MIAHMDELEDSLVVIGNSPSALITLCRIIDYGIKPRMVVGVPVGFVNASKSKEMLRQKDVPSISTIGTRGGTPVAVAIVNELIYMVS